MVAGLRLACLPLPFICLPTSFHLSPFLSFVSQARCLWSGSRPACLPLPFPLLFICLPVLFIFGLPGWVLVVGFPAGLSRTSFHLSPHFFSFVRLGLVVGFAAGLSPTCFHLSPTSFICLPGWVLVVRFPAGLSPTSFHLSRETYERKWETSQPGNRPTSTQPGRQMKRTGRQMKRSRRQMKRSGRQMKGSYFFSFVSHFFSFVSSSFHWSPRLGACGRVPSWLVSHFLSFVSHFFSFVFQFFSFVSQAGCLWSGSRLACLPLPFICLPLLFICLPVLFIFGLPGWVLVVGFPAGLSRTSFHLSPALLFICPAGSCGRVCGWLVSHVLSSRPACLPLPFICLPLFFCLWSGSRPLICLPLLFICHPLLFICLPGWVLVVGFPARLSPTCFHLSPGSFHLSPRNASFVSQVRHAM